MPRLWKMMTTIPRQISALCASYLCKARVSNYLNRLIDALRPALLFDNASVWVVRDDKPFFSKCSNIYINISIARWESTLHGNKPTTASQGWNKLNIFLHSVFGNIWSCKPLPDGRTPRSARNTAKGEPNRKKFSVLKNLNSSKKFYNIKNLRFSMVLLTLNSNNDRFWLIFSKLSSISWILKFSNKQIEIFYIFYTQYNTQFTMWKGAKRCSLSLFDQLKIVHAGLSHQREITYSLNKAFILNFICSSCECHKNAV